METIVTVAHLFVSLTLVALILIQHGKGADAGAAFGSGASGTVFGAQGSANFLTRTTGLLATAFFVLSLALGWFAINATKAPGLIIDEVPVVEEVTQPGSADTSVPAIPGTEAKTAEPSSLPAIPE